MKRYPRRKPAHHPRVPAFVPVTGRSRKDGWTARRQAAFLAALAITRSISAAARRVSMARETAYRLRRREGAESFAAAWDAILRRGDGSRRKVTPEEQARRALEGLVKPVIYRREHVATRRKADDSALLRYLAQLDRGQGSLLRESERSQGFACRSASSARPETTAASPRDTPPDTPGRSRTGAPFRACRGAGRSDETRR
jgi:hypothetical protein